MSLLATGRASRQTRCRGWWQRRPVSLSAPLRVRWPQPWHRTLVRLHRRATPAMAARLPHRPQSSRRVGGAEKMRHARGPGLLLAMQPGHPPPRAHTHTCTDAHARTHAQSFTASHFCLRAALQRARGRPSQRMLSDILWLGSLTWSHPSGKRPRTSSRLPPSSSSSWCCGSTPRQVPRKRGVRSTRTSTTLLSPSAQSTRTVRDAVLAPLACHFPPCSAHPPFRVASPRPPLPPQALWVRRLCAAGCSLAHAGSGAGSQAAASTRRPRCPGGLSPLGSRRAAPRRLPLLTPRLCALLSLSFSGF